MIEIGKGGTGFGENVAGGIKGELQETGTTIGRPNAP